MTARSLRVTPNSNVLATALAPVPGYSNRHSNQRKNQTTFTTSRTHL